MSEHARWLDGNALGGLLQELFGADSDVVDEVRNEVIPASGADAPVGGSTAQLLDLADLIAKRLPLIIGVVVALSMLLLLIVFRSG